MLAGANMTTYKDKTIAFRVTTAEYNVLHAAAELAGMKVSEYVREMVIRPSLTWKSYKFDRSFPLTTFAGTADYIRESVETAQALYGPDE